MPRTAAKSTSTRTSPPGPCTLAAAVTVCWRLTLSLCRIKNPLSGVPKGQLLSDVEQFARERDMPDIADLLKKGALVAKDPSSFETIEELNEDDKISLRREVTHKWDQPRVLYFTIILCSVGAAVQYVRYAFFEFWPQSLRSCPRVFAGAGIRPVRTAPTCLSLQSLASFLCLEPQTMTRITGSSVW